MSHETSGHLPQAGEDAVQERGAPQGTAQGVAQGAAPEFGIRPGEVAIDLPPSADAGVYFIGRIRTPWKNRADCPKNGRESQAVCSVEIDPAFRPALEGLEGTTHLWLLYFMDRAPRNLVVQVPRHYGRGRGTFALRSPARPNPIALSAVQLLDIQHGTLSVIGLDCLDGTPLIDIKPYFVSTDCFPEAVVGWHRERERER
ncbi:tRNA-Thr(GGU) m(6)t(6)A37 methyltransferase TsaA [Angulomicrobium tetraedrale]|uniref:tRNA-Thr(GGU) m(6)t(6)A37 methyltransferase TsaA n=1 Tax=Ancylobacter tetraedralis TaxID=217068 RepID=A0A839ZBM0_9HYPH|nr:tRNA (N6-threonylcarbamoyladenosine(37)-N6)-methyltransferase TrmO [Ancylobacter tetraedralis]MBB3772096.1 tRNA-Thr(GGU) m(6)t(6)A37 methyltransferase TsaA [Ancylobacter tetraedralis]